MPLPLMETFRQLAESNEMLFTGGFPKDRRCSTGWWSTTTITRCSFTDEDDGQGVNWYYARVVQANEQYAWSRPIWVEARG